jgi:hypothetical protein
LKPLAHRLDLMAEHHSNVTESPFLERSSAPERLQRLVPVIP